MIRIEIGARHYLLYLLLPHPLKMALLSAASRERLDRINRAFNEAVYSGEGATAYDRIHSYAGIDHHDYPAKPLVERVWPRDQNSYGRALELGAGSGYFTTSIARRARSVVCVELVPDMQTMIRARCEAEGLDNVEIVGASVFDLERRLEPASIDSAFVIQTLHHLHRRPEVFRILGHLVRPGGTLFLLEPHHNSRRVLRLFGKYLQRYRSRQFWSDEANWATHDFLTCSEIRELCRVGGFTDVCISGYWIPGSRRLVPEAERRFQLERRLGRLPFWRHVAGVLGVEARRTAESG